MTRLELLHLVVGRARKNGFEFRRWYSTRLSVPWISQEAAISLLATQRRYYALIFSHEFAQTFWKPGTEITFDVASQQFQRAMQDGTVRTIHRKPYIRRSLRPNAWRYHLKQMAIADEPLRYLRRYLHVEDDLIEESLEPMQEGKSTAPSDTTVSKAEPRPAAKKRSPQRPLPSELPAFLQRAYRPSSK